MKPSAAANKGSTAASKGSTAATKASTATGTASTAAPNASAIRILKIATCPTLSGKSELTYHVGCKANSEIQFRIYANTGRGFFSKEWISTVNIQKGFEKSQADEPITSLSMNGIFKGKSVNTQGFLLAVLKAEGLVSAISGKRGYQRAESGAFAEEIKALMQSSVALNADDKPGPALKVNKSTIQKGKAKKA